MNPFPCLLVLLALVLDGSGCARQEVAAVRSSVQNRDWQKALEEVVETEATKLVFAGPAVFDSDFQALQQPVFAPLIWLECDASNLSDAVVQKTLGKLPHLQRVRLLGPIDDADMQAIAKLPQLKILNLPDAVFTDQGLAELTSCESLELLRFSTPYVSDAGLKPLSEFPSLKFLHLINVPITDAGLPEIADIAGLQSFYLDGGDCTEDGLSELIKQRPDLHFHWNQLHLPDDPHAHPHDASGN